MDINHPDESLKIKTKCREASVDITKGETIMLKEIGRTTAYVSFTFGSFAIVGVTLYEGKTFEECLKLSSSEIDGYIKRMDNGEEKFVKIA
jgi:hypothetical protein